MQKKLILKLLKRLKKKKKKIEDVFDEVKKEEPFERY